MTSRPVFDVAAPMYAKTERSTRRWLVYAGYALLVLPLLLVFWFVVFQPIQVLPRRDLAPGFHLFDQTGARLTSEDLRGHLVLYNFTYSGCHGACPDTTAVMADVQRRAAQLDLHGIPFALVTISFDSETDTPEQLAAFARRAGARGEQWRFAGGEAAHVKQVIGGGFGVYYNRLETGEFEFAPTFVLVDGWGIQRGVYRTATPDPETLLRDIGLLAREAANSRGVQRFAYEAAHLFLCFPG